MFSRTCSNENANSFKYLKVANFWLSLLLKLSPSLCCIIGLLDLSTACYTSHMYACLTTSSPTGGPTRGYPAHSVREGRTTGRVPRKFEQDSDSVPSLSRTPNRRPSQRKSHSRPPSPSSFDNSSDDDILGPITPPPILRDLAHYVKSAKERPGPYKRTNPNIIERFCGEECSGCNGSTTLVDKQRVRWSMSTIMLNIT